MKYYNIEECEKNRRAVQDTLELVNGKWKLIILITLRHRSYRFKELAREIGITPKMLSKELQDLEVNKLVSRKVLQTKPIGVEYAITKHGLTFENVMVAMRDWGLTYREKIISAIKEDK